MADWESRITPSLRDDEAELEASIESCVALCHCMASEEDEDHLSYDDARCRAAEARAAARGCGGRGGHGGAAPMEALAPAAPLVPRPPPSRVLKPQPLPWVPRSLLADLKTHEAAALVGLHASTRLPQPRPQGRDLVCFLPKNWRARAKPQKRLTSIGFQEQSRPLPPKPRAPKAETPMPGFAVSFGDDAFKCGRRVRGPPALPAALPTAPTEPSMLMPRGLDALQAKDRFDASQALALQDSRLFRSTSESDFVQTSQHCKRWAALASMLDRHELVAADAIQALRGAKGTRGADVQGAFQGSDAQGAGSPSSALRSAKTFAAASATRGGASPRAPASSGPATPVDAVFDAAAIVSTLAQLCGAVGRNVADRVAAMSQWRGEMLRSALQEFESFATDAVGGAATVLRGRILQLDGSGAVLAVVVAGVQEKHLTMQNVLARRLDDVAHMRKQVTVNDVAAARLAEIYRRKAAAKLIQAKFLEGLCCKNQPEADEGTNAQRKNQPKADEATEQGGAPRQASVRRGLGRGASAGGASVGGASAGAPAGGLLAGGCGAVGLGGLLADADGGHRASTPQAPLHVSFKLGNASLSKLVDASSFEIGDASSAPVSAASAHGIFLKQTCDAPLTQGEKYLVKKLNRAVVPLQAAWRRTAGLKYVQAMRYALRNADLRRATARLTRATRSDVESMHASVDGLEATFVRGVSTPRKAFEPGKTPVAATSRSVRLRREAVEARHAARRVRDVSAIGELAERLRSMALLAYRHARRNFALQELRSVVAQWRKRRPRPKAALDLYGMFVDYVQGLENGQAVHLDIGDAIGDDAASWRSSRDAASRRSSDASAGSFSDGEDLVGGDAGKRGHKGPLAQPLSLLAVARRQKRKIHEPTGEAAPGAWDAALRPAALQGNLVAQKFAAMPMAGAVIPYAGAGVPLASAESRALPFRAAAAAFSPSAFSKVKKGARRASVAPTSTQRAAAATSPRRASQPAAAAQPAVSAAREAFAAQVRKQSAQQAAQQAAAQQVVAQDGAAERASPVLDDLAAAESRAASGRVVVMVPQSSSPFRASPLQSEASPEMLRFVPEPLQFASLDSGASPVADTAVKAAQRSACAALFAMDLPGFVSEKRRRQSVVAAKRLSTLMAVKHQRSLRPLRPVFDMQAEFARQALYSDYEEPPHPSKKAPSVADSGDDAISKSESGVGAAPAQHRAISRVALRVVREHKDALGLLLTPQHRSTLVADISKVVAEATPRRGAAWLRLRYHELTLALRRRFGAPSVNFDQMPSLGWFPNCLLDAEIQLAVAAGFKGFAVDEKFEKCGCQCTDAHTFLRTHFASLKGESLADAAIFELVVITLAHVVRATPQPADAAVAALGAAPPATAHRADAVVLLLRCVLFESPPVATPALLFVNYLELVLEDASLGQQIHFDAKKLRRDAAAAAHLCGRPPSNEADTAAADADDGAPHGARVYSAVTLSHALSVAAVLFCVNIEIIADLVRVDSVVAVRITGSIPQTASGRRGSAGSGVLGSSAFGDDGDDGSAGALFDARAELLTFVRAVVARLEPVSYSGAVDAPEAAALPLDAFRTLCVDFHHRQTKRLREAHVASLVFRAASQEAKRAGDEPPPLPLRHFVDAVQTLDADLDDVAAAAMFEQALFDASAYSIDFSKFEQLSRTMVSKIVANADVALFLRIGYADAVDDLRNTEHLRRRLRAKHKAFLRVQQLQGQALLDDFGETRRASRSSRSGDRARDSLASQSAAELGPVDAAEARRADAAVQVRALPAQAP